jgi:hypothetical protein
MPTTETQKSPYQRGNSSRRGRGWMLTATVVVLLIATAAWFTTYTRGIETSNPNVNTQSMDPVAHPALPAAPVTPATR